MTLRTAATYRALALEMCKGKPGAIRELVLQLAGACDDGSPLLNALRMTPVPGRIERERRARHEWLHKQVALLIKWCAHMDIVTADVGRAPDKTFYGLRVGPKKIPDGKSLSEWLSETTDDSGEQRTCERVIEALSKGGFVESWGRSKFVDGEHRGMCSVRKITVRAIVQLLPGSRLAWWEKVCRDECAARKARDIEAERAAKLSPEIRARIDLAEAAAKDAARHRRRARDGRGEFLTGADLVSRALGTTGPPKPS